MTAKFWFNQVFFFPDIEGSSRGKCKPVPAQGSDVAGLSFVSQQETLYEEFAEEWFC